MNAKKVICELEVGQKVSGSVWVVQLLPINIWWGSTEYAVAKNLGSIVSLLPGVYCFLGFL